MVQSVSAATLGEPGLVIDLTSPESMADDLGSFGMTVTQREVPIAGRKRTSQREAFALRRLLVAWRLLGRLVFPTQIVATTERSPDFLLAWGLERTRVAVEVTEATNRDWQRRLTETAQLSSREGIELLPNEDGYTQIDVINQLVSEIWTAIRAKVQKDYRWSDVSRRHLLIYVNSDAPWFAGDLKAVVAGVRQGRGITESAPANFDEVHLIFREIVVVDAYGDAEFVDVSAEYEIDLVKWAHAKARALRAGELTPLDRSNIAEELESMARRDERALRSQMRRLILHLLKWQAQPGRRSASWRRSIDNARDAIDDLLDDNPSLDNRPELERLASAEFKRARRRAIEETGLSEQLFPESSEFTRAQLLDHDFLPGS